jgi:hypothetical protein
MRPRITQYAAGNSVSVSARSRKPHRPDLRQEPHFSISSADLACRCPAQSYDESARAPSVNQIRLNPRMGTLFPIVPIRVFRANRGPQSATRWDNNKDRIAHGSALRFADGDAAISAHPHCTTESAASTQPEGVSIQNNEVSIIRAYDYRPPLFRQKEENHPPYP